MTVGPRLRAIKHAQRESFFQREIATLIQRLAFDDAALAGVFVSRVSLSPDRGSCTVFIGMTKPSDNADEKIRQLVLYKPSLRTALAKTVQTRRVPELFFKYDPQIEKGRRLEELFEQIKKEDRSE